MAKVAQVGGIVAFNFPHQARHVVAHAVPLGAGGFGACVAPSFALFGQHLAASPNFGEVKARHASTHLGERAFLGLGIAAKKRVLLQAPQVGRPVDGAAHGVVNPGAGGGDVFAAPVNAGVVEQARGCGVCADAGHRHIADIGTCDACPVGHAASLPSGLLA